MRDYLKSKLGVPENWDKYDYQTQRYSFEDIEEILQTFKDEQWRRGAEMPMESPKLIGMAIDKAVEVLDRTIRNNSNPKNK